MSTVETLLREGAAALVPAGIERPQSEARALLEAATGLSRAALLGFPERTVAAGDEERFLGWLARRTQREPMAYILGEVEFWSLRFAVRPGVLIARHDSETLIEAAIAVFPGSGAVIAGARHRRGFGLPAADPAAPFPPGPRGRDRSLRDSTGLHGRQCAQALGDGTLGSGGNPTGPPVWRGSSISSSAIRHTSVQAISPTSSRR